MKKAVTLTELIIAIALMGVIILGVTSFDSSSRQFFKSSETKTQIMNDGTLILDRMSKDALSGIGDFGNAAITVTNPGVGPSTVVITQDTNLNGARDPGTDVTITYALVGNQLQRTVAPNPAETVSTRVVSFIADAPVGNSVVIHITMRPNPAAAQSTFDNPQITLQGCVEVPAWSVQ